MLRRNLTLSSLGQWACIYQRPVDDTPGLFKCFFQTIAGTAAGSTQGPVIFFMPIKTETLRVSAVYQLQSEWQILEFNSVPKGDTLILPRLLSLSLPYLLYHTS